MLKKAHIGEVQSSVWSKEDIELFAKHNIHLL
jgi:asparagine synthetase A